MKTLSILALAICLSVTANAQQRPRSSKVSVTKSKAVVPVDMLAKFSSKDLSSLWLHTENRLVYGYIGDNFQRLRIKFITITQDSGNVYRVSGKSKVKNNICSFKGTLILTGISKLDNVSYGVDDEYKGSGITGQYAISGKYQLTEDTTQPGSGVFEGKFETSFYQTKDGKIHYDDIQKYADGFENNTFAGNWTGNSTRKAKICNWGDYRIPNSKGLDIGAGEFSPDKKFWPLGWQSVADSYYTESKNYAIAKQEETKQWWK